MGIFFFEKLCYNSVMKLKNWQIYAVIASVSVIAAAIVGVFYFKHQQDDFSNKPQDLKYEKIITEKDSKPLPIPDKTKTVKIPVLMYHHVGDYPPKASPMRQDLTVATADFADQAKWLSEQGFTSITLEDIYLYSQGKFALPKKPVVFTFDDGYDDVFLNALPILKQYNFIGSFAIITRYPGEKQGDNFYASWPEIAAAHDAGNEVVSHTQNHFDAHDKKYSADFISQNLAGSIEDIKNHLGFTTNVLVYPYGHYTPAEITTAKSLGFVIGFTIHEGEQIDLNNLMEIPRIRVHGKENIETFKKILSR